VRNIIQAELNLQGGSILSFYFEANGFLRHMVRNIIGAVAKVGLGEISVACFHEILESKGERHAQAKAPPWGLYLKEVRY
jgi:tRNA pseudouridine38-40 synthase